jgi:hypothetical protein
MLRHPSLMPWYVSWLLPLTLFSNGSVPRSAVAHFAALAPSMYLTRFAGAAAILIANGLPLLVLFGPDPQSAAPVAGLRARLLRCLNRTLRMPDAAREPEGVRRASPGTR